MATSGLTAERTRIFEPGNAAALEVGDNPPFSTVIEAIVGETLVVATPLLRGEYVEMRRGQEVVLSVSRRGSPYLYPTEVLYTTWNEGKQLTVLRRPADNAGIAPRADIRVPVSIRGQFWWEDEETAHFGPSLEGALIDLSAGGFQSLTRAALPVGKSVIVRFPLTRELGHPLLRAEVLRQEERMSDLGVRTFRAHCRWIGLSESDHDTLIRFVFGRERELRQKGVF